MTKKNNFAVQKTLSIELGVGSAMVFFLCLAAVVGLSAAEISVAADENDPNPGTLAKPVATLRWAQAMARKVAEREAVTVAGRGFIICRKSVEQFWTQKQKLTAAGELAEAEKAYDHAGAAYRKLLAEAAGE